MHPRIKSIVLLVISAVLSPIIALLDNQVEVQFVLVGFQIACIAIAGTSMKSTEEKGDSEQ